MTLYRPTEPPEVLGPRFRERALELRRSALVSVDMQNGDCSRKKRLGPTAAGAEGDERYFFERLERTVIPNQQKLHAATRRLGIENIYVVIESLTKDGRDRGLTTRPPSSTTRAAHGRRGSSKRSRRRTTTSSYERRHPVPSARRTSTMCCGLSTSAI